MEAYFINGDLRAASSAQAPTMKLSPLQAVSSYFRSAQRAEQVRHQIAGVRLFQTERNVIAREVSLADPLLS